MISNTDSFYVPNIVSWDICTLYFKIFNKFQELGSIIIINILWIKKVNFWAVK